MELRWGKSNVNEENTCLAICALYQENMITSDIPGGFSAHWHLCNTTVILMKSLDNDYIRGVTPLKKNDSVFHLWCTLSISDDDLQGLSLSRREAAEFWCLHFHQGNAQLPSYFQSLTRKQHLEVLYYVTAYKANSGSHSGAIGNYCFSPCEAWEPQSGDLGVGEREREGDPYTWCAHRRNKVWPTEAAAEWLHHLHICIMSTIQIHSRMVGFNGK